MHAGTRTPHPLCRMLVLIPAKDEDARIGACIDAFARQRSPDGRAIDPRSFELRILINNSSDHTARVVRARRRRYPHLQIIAEEVSFARAEANIGFIRRSLFETAARDLRFAGRALALATTDADTRVGPTWIAANLLALADHDLVCGNVLLQRTELTRAAAPQRRLLAIDRAWRTRVARYAALIDPIENDPWPHHYHHTGASLAIRSETYAKAGGMPKVTASEDIALVRAAFAVQARIRHDPRVHVSTSPRLDGRAHAGMSATLRHWQAAGADLYVTDTLVLRERLLLRAAVRRACAGERSKPREAAEAILAALRQARRTGFPADALHEMLRSGRHFGEVWTICRAWFETAAESGPPAILCAAQEEVRRLDYLIATERAEFADAENSRSSERVYPSAERTRRPMRAVI